MIKETLKELVEKGLSSYRIAKELKKSPSTVKYWLDKFGFSTKRIHKCRLCDETDPNNFSPGRFTECRKCRVNQTNKICKQHKIELVRYKGGKCVVCGYNKCFAALDFHHKNPNEKDPNWRKMRNWSVCRVKNEIDKCDLVCRNCHSEIHYGIDT